MTSIDHFIDALARGAADGNAIDEQRVSDLMNRSARRGGLTALTPREHEILSLMAEALTNPGIGRRLHLSDRTVEFPRRPHLQQNEDYCRSETMNTECLR